jgi:hypothetical protein
MSESEHTDAELDELREATASELNTNRNLRQAASEAGRRQRHEEVETTNPHTDAAEAAREINGEVRWAVERALLEGVKEADELPDELEGEAYDVVRDEVVQVADRIMDDVCIGKHALSELLADRQAREPDRDPDAEYEKHRLKQAGEF